MPILATPTTPRLVSRDEVRRWLRDYPPGYVPGTGVLSVLLDGVEFSDADIDAGLQHAADRYNGVTPVTNLSPDLLPRVLLLYGAVAYLLQSESFRQLRNQADAQDGDVAPVGLDSKNNPYAQNAMALWQKWDELARGVKTQRNMEAVFGGLSSGYLSVSRTIYG